MSRSSPYQFSGNRKSVGSHRRAKKALKRRVRELGGRIVKVQGYRYFATGLPTIYTRIEWGSYRVFPACQDKPWPHGFGDPPGVGFRAREVARGD